MGQMAELAKNIFKKHNGRFSHSDWSNLAQLRSAANSKEVFTQLTHEIHAKIDVIRERLGHTPEGVDSPSFSFLRLSKKSRTIYHKSNSRGLSEAIKYGKLLPLYLVMGCAMHDSLKQIVLNGVTYKFPKHYVTQYVPAGAAPDQPKGAARLVKEAFKLDHIESNYKDSPLGKDFPNVFSISSSYGHQAELINSQNVIVVCKEVPQNISMHFDCGVNISDGDVKWSLLFDRSDIDKISSIILEARNMLSAGRDYNAN